MSVSALTNPTTMATTTTTATTIETTATNLEKDEKKKIQNEKAKHFSFDNCCEWSKQCHQKTIKNPVTKYCTYCGMNGDPLDPKLHFHKHVTENMYDLKEPWTIETDFAFHSPSCALAYIQEYHKNFEVQARKLIYMLHSNNKYQYKLSCPRIMTPRELQLDYIKTFPSWLDLHSTIVKDDKDFKAEELKPSSFLSVTDEQNSNWIKQWAFDGAFTFFS
jgi:hypothetical protein